MAATELETVGINESATDLRARINDLADRVETLTMPDAKTVYDQLDMMREWAKLQADAEQIAKQLLWLDALLLRHMGRTNMSVLTPHRKAAAKFYAGMDDAELAAFLEASNCPTANGAFLLFRRTQQRKAAYDAGERFAQGERAPGRIWRLDENDEWRYSGSHEEQLSCVRDAVKYAQWQVTTVREAGAVILNHYTQGLERFTVADVVEEFINDELPELRKSSTDERFFRAGLTDAVRAAACEESIPTTERSDTIPAYILTYAEDVGWVRVRSEFATVGDALQMLALRREQVAQMSAAVDRLQERLEYCSPLDPGRAGDWLRDDPTAIRKRMLLATRPVAEQHEAMGLIPDDIEEA